MYIKTQCTHYIHSGNWRLY